MLQEKRIELGCFLGLQQQEALALPQRLSVMRALVAEQRAREAQLQTQYEELLRTRQTLQEQVSLTPSPTHPWQPSASGKLCRSDFRSLEKV